MRAPDLPGSEGAPARAPRVAVCLSGIARNPRQNLAHTRAFLAGVDCDVFFHYWDSPDADLIVQTLAPKAHVFESPRMAPPPPVPVRREKFVPPTREVAIASMHYSMSRANQLKRAYEEAHGFRYDVVVRMRPDFFSTTRLADLLALVWRERAADPDGWERTLFVPHMFHAGGINDQFAMGSSSALDVYASTPETMAHYAATGYFVAEYFLLRHLLDRGLRIRMLPFEYVLLRDDTVSTFDLEPMIHGTRYAWWSGPLPHVALERSHDLFAARADSVELVDAYDAETPRVFRLRSPRRGYVRWSATTGRFGYAPDAAGASTFFVIVARDEDRTKVNIRPRDAVFKGDTLRPGAKGAVNLRPDRTGRLSADAPADEYSAFLLGRQDGGVTFEWYPGFWTTVDAERAEAPRVPGGPAATAPAPATTRQFVQAGPDGLVLAPAGAADLVFELEYVPDAVAEAAPFGLLAGHGPPAADTALGRMLWLSYRAVRYWEQRGARHVAARTSAAVRRRAGRLLGRG